MAQFVKASQTYINRDADKAEWFAPMVECLATDAELEFVSLNQLGLLVDLYQYLPVKTKLNPQARVKSSLSMGKKRYANQDARQSATLIKEIDIDKVLSINQESASLT